MVNCSAKKWNCSFFPHHLPQIFFEVGQLVANSPFPSCSNLYLTYGSNCLLVLGLRLLQVGRSFNDYFKLPAFKRKLSSSHALNRRRRTPTHTAARRRTPPHAAARRTPPQAVDCHRLVTPSLVLLADRQIAHATTVKVKSESNFATHFLRLEKQNFVLRFCKAAFLHFCTFSFPFDILQF